VVDNIRLNMTIEPVPDLSQIGTAGQEEAGTERSGAGLLFELHRIQTRARRSRICNELTSMMLEDHLQGDCRTRPGYQRRA
jgi:hypothetical protein